MMTRRFVRVGLLAVLALTGCGPGLFDVVGGLTGGGNDGDAALAARNLSYVWTVTGYSGVEVGAVTVPAAAGMRWTFDSGFTFTVVSQQPISLGGDLTTTYDEAGTWRIIDAKAGRLGLTLTRHGGLDVPLAERGEVEATFNLQQTQLVLNTAALGPGTIRYVLAR